MVAKKKEYISPLYEPNKHFLVCGHCGKRGLYDLGRIFLHPDFFLEYMEDNVGVEDDEKIQTHFLDLIQSTAYFRCKSCNGAGEWQNPSHSIYYDLTTEMLVQGMNGSRDYPIATLALHDGSSHRWASEREEHLLDQIEKAKDDAYLWNKLGNIYYKGGRPELAVVAFEQSLHYDPTQIESHFSLGQILVEIDELEKAAYHFRMMLVYARMYQHLDAIQLRNILVAGLQELLMIHEISNRSIPFLPVVEELQKAKEQQGIETGSELTHLQFVEMSISPDEPDSLKPLAEMYMGDRQAELPFKERTLDVYRRAQHNKLVDLSKYAKKVVKQKGKKKRW
jgi:tetratricopeptide (TPR) repeat protein